MAINHAAIIAQYQFPTGEARRLQQDAVARLDAETRAGNFAAELRASAKKPINKSVWPGAKRCKACGASGRNVATYELVLLCRNCGALTWRWP